MKLQPIPFLIHYVVSPPTLILFLQHNNNNYNVITFVI